MGAKKRPFYRIVAADSRRSRNGRFLDEIGTYNPVPKPAEVIIEEQKMAEWLDNGAVPSDTVGTLLTQIGFMEKYLKARKGDDVAAIGIKTTIKERPKKTRRMRKASVAAEAPTA